MKKALSLMSLLLLFPGCAIVGSERYFSAGTNGVNEGRPEWTGDPGILRITGKPDSIRYAKDEIELSVFSPHIAAKTYSFGPCIPIPLPIIPVFGLKDTERVGPVEIRFNMVRSQRQFQLVQATVVADNRSLSPEKISSYPHAAADEKNVSHDMRMPLLLIDHHTYVLTYGLLSSSTAAYDLLFFIKDDSGDKFFKGKISFKRDSTTTFDCLP